MGQRRVRARRRGEFVAKAKKDAKGAHEAAVAAAEDKAEGVAPGDAYLWVVRTVTRLRSGGGGVEDNPDEENIEDNMIRVGVFKTVPARVMVTKGLTLNLGNYESARVTVGFESPCYPEEVKEVEGCLNEFVEERLKQEVSEIRHTPDDE
jgi:hypothetical protein